MKRVKTKEPINLATCANPYNLDLRSLTETYTFYGTVTLSGNFVIQGSGTPKPTMTCMMIFDSAITAGAYSFSILGTAINKEVLKSPFIAMAKYDLNTSAWIVIYHNVVIAKADGTTITEAGGTIGVGTIGNTQFSSQAGEKLAWSKVNSTGQIVNADIKSDAAIDYTKMAALTASEIVITNSSGVPVSAAVATYPSLAELAFLKNVSSAIQTQLNTLTSTFANYTTTSAMNAIFANYSTTAAMNAAIAAAIYSAYPIKDVATISGSTDLSAVAALHQEYLLNAAGGAADTILPLAGSVAINTPLRLTLYGADTPSDITPKGTDTILEMDATTTSAMVTLNKKGDFIQLVSNGSNQWKIIAKQITAP